VKLSPALECTSPFSGQFRKAGPPNRAIIMARSLAHYHAAMLGACLLAAASGCTDTAPTAPVLVARAVASAQATGGGGPRVSSTSPDSGAQNTTLSVRVLGSGFSQGTRAIWAIKGDTTFAVTKVKTNSTTFVSSTELVANITISADASLSLYDVVALTATGKKGIGIECFTVTTVIGVTDLGTLGGNTSYVLAMNTPSVGTRLLMVGVSQDKTGARRAAYWYVDMASGARQSGFFPTPPGGGQGYAEGVNQSEAVVGSTVLTVGGGVPVRWAPGGFAPSFLSVTGIGGGSAAAITDAGEIVGFAGEQATVWDGQIRTDLSTFGNGSQAIGVNAFGVVVGASRYFGDQNSRAFVWTKPGPIVQLPDAGYTESFAIAINDAGVIVGFVWSAIGGDRAVRWLPSATTGGTYTMQDLGLASSVAYDINNAGEIVGNYLPSSSSYSRAFYWIDGTLKDLPGLGLYAVAHTINENGDVAGWGYLHNGYQHAVLWTHVR
jgi:probable HAF family extracellular repeat protein